MWVDVLGPVLIRGWLDRLEIDLSQPESQTSRSYLMEACNDAEEWHNLRADREADAGNFDLANVYLSDWIIIGEICNKALFDDEWDEAASQLTAVRP